MYVSSVATVMSVTKYSDFTIYFRFKWMVLLSKGCGLGVNKLLKLVESFLIALRLRGPKEMASKARRMKGRERGKRRRRRRKGRSLCS